MPHSRKGSETPRLFTPPLRELTPETTLGFAAVRFAEDVCKTTLLPWQSWLLIHALELAPELTTATMHERGPLDPLFRFRRVVTLVARQNGKSTLSQVLALFSMYVLGTPMVLGTAQDLDTAEEVWDGALDMIEENPELAELADKPIRVNGKKTIRLLNEPALGVHGERYKVKSATRGGGRGLTGDLIIMDELREHQNWDAWAAITKTTMARPAAQIWALSNAGDATSVVLRYLRKAAHGELGDPDGINQADDPSALLPTDGELPDATDVLVEEEDGASRIGLFEWSAEPGCELNDIDGLAAANPAMGHLISERVLRAEAQSDPEWVFRTECLCQWSDGTLEGLFPSGTWEDQSDEASAIAPGEPIIGCLTVSWDRSRSYVAIAGLREDGRVHLGVVASRSGTDWVADYLRGDESPPLTTLVVQERGAPESSLIEELRRYNIPLTVWGGGDLAAAHGTFYDAVALGTDGGLRHRNQPLLEVAVATSTSKPLGEAWVLDLRKSAGDAAPLKATIGAVWGRTNIARHTSAYETDEAHSVMVF